MGTEQLYFVSAYIHLITITQIQNYIHNEVLVPIYNLIKVLYKRL